MDDVAVDAHFAEPRRHGDRLVGNHPDLAGETIHLHGEAHRWVDRPVPLGLQGGDDGASGFVGPFARVMELQVGDRAGRAADRLAVHPADDADQPLGPGVEAQDVRSLVVELTPPDRDEANVVGPRVEAEPAEPLSVKPRGRHARVNLPVPDHGWVLVKLRHVGIPE